MLYSTTVLSFTITSSYRTPSAINYLNASQVYNQTLSYGNSESRFPVRFTNICIKVLEYYIRDITEITQLLWIILKTEICLFFKQITYLFSLFITISLLLLLPSRLTHLEDGTDY